MSLKNLITNLSDLSVNGSYKKQFNSDDFENLKNFDSQKDSEEIEETDLEKDKFSEVTTFHKFENKIKQVTSEEEILALKEAMEVLEQYYEIIQDKLRQVVCDNDGNNIKPDGKISFEPVVKKTKDKEYVYLRLSWKENGVKKGKSLPYLPKMIINSTDKE